MKTSDRTHLAEVHLEHAIIHEALGNPQASAAELEKALQYEGPVKIKKQIKKAAKSFASAAKKASKKVVKVVKAEKRTYGKSSAKSSGRAGKSGKWMCEKCGSTFGSQASAELHESRHRGGSSMKHLTVKPHAAMTAKCKWCGKWHTKSQCASHGPGSFEDTHPGLFDEE